MVSIALRAAPASLEAKPRRIFPSWESALLARAVSVTGSAGSKGAYGPVTACPQSCPGWSLCPVSAGGAGGDSASAAAPGLEENTAPWQSRLLRTRPVRFPTARQCLPPDERGAPGSPGFGEGSPRPGTHEDLPRGAPQVSALSPSPGGHRAPRHPARHPTCTRCQPSAQNWVTRAFKYIFLHLEST